MADSPDYFAGLAGTDPSVSTNSPTVDPSVSNTTSTSVTDTGPASALSTIGTAVTGALTAVGNFLTSISKPKFPIANPLFGYATYNYVLGIAALTTDQLNNPDSTYMKGAVLPLICKTAGASPNNRINIPGFGQFEFYIDNLEIHSTIGLEKGSNTNMTSMEFDIIEPYSMGLFFLALQQAAASAKRPNWRDAAFLLTIDFQGNTETGSMVNIPNTSRKIPFKFLETEMSVTEKGSIYHCKAYSANSEALDDAHKQLKSDTSVAGKTVQEALQTGPKSLQAVINGRLQGLKENGTVAEPDQVLILFPADIASASSGSTTGATETVSAPTTTVIPGLGTAANPAAGIQKTLGVTSSKINNTLVQDAASCNELGKANLGFGITRKADTPGGRENEIWDPVKKVWLRSSNIIDPATGEMRFSQDTDIINAINQIMLTSEFATKTLEPNAKSPEGYRKWWRIDTQVYIVSSTANLTTTGKEPKIIVYRVVPYNVHASRFQAPNTTDSGFKSLALQVVKQYDYIYTGKNVDILSFDIKFNVGFTAVASANPFLSAQGPKISGDRSGSVDVKNTNIAQLPAGNAPETKLGVNNTQASFTKTKSGTDGLGGGGTDTQGTRAARHFHDAITNRGEMVELSLKILGDPYYIAQSGQGNFTDKPVSQNLNVKGDLSYQSGEVDIIINFRTPLDVNQTTGMYNFGSSSPSGAVMMWSGFYRVIEVTSSFRSGQFTQTLTGARRDQAEGSQIATSAQTVSSQTPLAGKEPDMLNEDNTIQQAELDANGNVTTASQLDPNKWGNAT